MIDSLRIPQSIPENAVLFSNGDGSTRWLPTDNYREVAVQSNELNITPDSPSAIFCLLQPGTNITLPKITSLPGSHKVVTLTDLTGTCNAYPHVITCHPDDKIAPVMSTDHPTEFSIFTNGGTVTLKSVQNEFWTFA